MARKKKMKKRLAQLKPANLQNLGRNLQKVNKIGIADRVRSLSKSKPASLQKLGDNLGKKNPFGISDFKRKDRRLLSLV